MNKDSVSNQNKPFNWSICVGDCLTKDKVAGVAWCFYWSCMCVSSIAGYSLYYWIVWV